MCMSMFFSSPLQHILNMFPAPRISCACPLRARDRHPRHRGLPIYPEP
jgi:hypothetical protein